jgi:phage FluMu protein Com
MKRDVAIAISSRIAEKPDLRNLLQRFLSYAYADPRERNRKWMEKVKHDIHTLCVTSAFFDLNKQWQEHHLVPAPSLRARYRGGHLEVSIGSRRVTTWTTQLKDVLDRWYPKQFSTPEPIAVSACYLPVKLFGIELLGRVGEIRRAIVRKNKKVITSKVSAHIRTCYVVGWPDIFWFAIANLLEEFASDFIRCTECRKLFLKTKRQGYCSSACRITRWRRENPHRLSEIRRRAYVRHVHKIHPRAIIQRRGSRLVQQSKGD